MTDFKPTAEQQVLINEARRRFEESAESTQSYSKRFIEKCNDQNGVATVVEQNATISPPEHPQS